MKQTGAQKEGEKVERREKQLAEKTHHGHETAGLHLSFPFQRPWIFVIFVNCNDNGTAESVGRRERRVWEERCRNDESTGLHLSFI
jgi:hypothetical protein